MNYWHIQLHPDNKLHVDTIKSILTTKQVIGMGESWEDKNGNSVNDPKWFKEDMKIGDVVMVRDGSTPIALVKVIGNAYVEPNTDDNFDWFRLRRSIETLGIFGKDEKKLLKQTLLNYEKNHIQAPGTLTYCNGSNATNDFIVEWHKLSNHKRLMENIKLTPDRQAQIKTLWDKFKKDTKEQQRCEGFDELLEQWNQYRDKITNNTLTLDEYTNTLSNSTATMPGGYLCNFLERTTRNNLGSSKPGNANNFEVKLNEDNQTYYIKSQKKTNANRQEAEAFFNEKIKPLLTKIVSASAPLDKIHLIEDANYSAKQILMKLAVLENLTDILQIYKEESIEDF